jgi:glycosyltransferase involved in cell wall biosynthesis
MAAFRESYQGQNFSVSSIYTMRIVFIDGVGWPYDVSTPSTRPIGGSQSALCYLATALHERGHAVRILNSVGAHGVVRGIMHHNIDSVTATWFSEPKTAYIWLNPTADQASLIRPLLPASSVIVQWQQHAHDQPAVQGMIHGALHSAWDRFVFLSDWQKRSFEVQFGLAPSRSLILRNAASPFCLAVSNDRSQLFAAKSDTCRLVYTSTPYRGLQYLMEWFPILKREFPKIKLQIFSSLAVYFCAEEDAEDLQLYELCRKTDGVEYFGGLPQPILAQHLQAASILAYPNVFAETSCIAAIEAMVAGLSIVSTDLGALPETCLGQARLAFAGSEADALQNLKRNWIGHMGEELEMWYSDFEGWCELQWSRVEKATAEYSWDHRAEEWERMLASLLESQD